MKRTTFFTLLLLAAATSAYAQSSPAFDPDVYIPKLGVPGEIDTVHGTTAGFGSGLINLGPSPESGGFGRMAMSGIPGNEAYLTTIQTGHSFDLQNLDPIRKLHFNVTDKIVHWGHLLSLQTTDIVVSDGGTGIPKIYWGDSLGNYDSSRFTSLRALRSDPRFKFAQNASDGYISYLTSDTVEDIAILWAGVDSTGKNGAVYALFFRGGEKLRNSGNTAYADSIVVVGTDVNTLYRHFSQGDWRGVGRDDLIAEELDSGNWHYFKNDPPFSLAKFAEAMIGDTIFRTRDNPTYSLMYQNQMSVRALPKVSGDKSLDFMPTVQLKTESNPDIFIFRGGAEFGSHPLTLDSAEAHIHNAIHYDPAMQAAGVIGFGGVVQDAGDMTGTGNRVMVTYAGDFSNLLAFFYVLGRAVDDKVDMFYTDAVGPAGDSIQGDADSRTDFLMGEPTASRLLLIHGSSKIPVKLNPRYRVVSSSASAQRIMEAYPNPASTHTTLTLEMPKGEEVTISLRDVLGRAVWQEKQRLGEGIVQTAVHFGALANGTYVVEVEGSSMRLSARIAVLR